MSYGDDVATCPLDGAALSGAPRGDPLLGRTIKGRYRIVSRLGDGGMGAVYRAEQLSVGRTVALKVLHREFARDEEFVHRFHQEARLAAGLNHPRLTTVFDFDQSEDGSLFIVMEYLEGTRLSDLIQSSSPLEIARAVRLAIQIGEGIEAAHAAGVIHRDIKPQNIMVRAPGDDVKLMDFGIARLNDGGDVQLTRAGAMMGTPLYMSPEQIEGRAVGEKTDIYAFGVVLYEMLSGQTPFSAPTSAAVLAKQLNEAPRPLRAARPDVPPVLERIVMQALDKDPEYRQERIAEVVRGLRAVAGTAAPAPDETYVSTRTIVSGGERTLISADGLGDETMVADRTTVGRGAGEAEARTGVSGPTAPERATSGWARFWAAHAKIMVISAGVLVVVVAVLAWSVHAGWWVRGDQGSQAGAPKGDKGGSSEARTDSTKDTASSGTKDNVSNQELWKRSTPDQNFVNVDGGQSKGADTRKRADDRNNQGSPGRPPDRPRPLTSIKAAVEQALSRAQLLRDPPDSKGPGVLVKAVESNGRVSLIGVLRDEAEKQKAMELARSVAGVTGVDAEINTPWD